MQNAKRRRLLNKMASSFTGSRLLDPLAQASGIPIDQINFVACQVVGVLLATLYRAGLHPSNTTPATRHAVSLLLGLGFAHFCFGMQLWHLIAQATMCYIIMWLAPPTYKHKLVFVAAMLYLAAMHIGRLVYDYGNFTLDVTGPLMISTQKLTSLAFSLEDGLLKDKTRLSPDQQQQALGKMPTLLELYSYIFYFYGLLVGPMCFYNDYKAFMEGSHFKKSVPSKDGTANGQVANVSEPSPANEVAKKITEAILYCVIMLTLAPIFPKPRNADESFIRSHGFFIRVVFLFVSVGLARAKYYFAWKLGEAMNNAAGLGFNGYDESGKPKWDLINNVNVWALETGTSVKLFVDNWNIQTTVWLRRVCYERVPKHKTLMTYILSAFWHGFYPGYYFSFVGASFFTMAARKVRRTIRPHFLTSRYKKRFYDVVTWVAAQLSMAYLIVPFTVMELKPIMLFYHSSMYWFMHILTFLLIMLVPNTSRSTVKPDPKSQEDKSKGSVDQNSSAHNSATTEPLISEESKKTS